MELKRKKTKENIFSKSRSPILKKILLVLFLTTLILAIIYVRFIGDGTDKYTGVEKEAAMRVLTFAEEREEVQPISLVFKHRVEDVYPTETESEWYNVCKGMNDPQNIAHYSVRISAWSFFALPKYFDVVLCQTGL